VKIDVGAAAEDEAVHERVARPPQLLEPPAADGIARGRWLEPECRRHPVTVLRELHRADVNLPDLPWGSVRIGPAADYGLRRPAKGTKLASRAASPRTAMLAPASAGRTLAGVGAPSAKKCRANGATRTAA